MLELVVDLFDLGDAIDDDDTLDDADENDLDCFLLRPTALPLLVGTTVAEHDEEEEQKGRLATCLVVESSWASRLVPVGYEGEETGEDLAMVVAMDEVGDGAGDWNKSPPKAFAFAAALCAFVAVALAALNDAELPVKLKEESEEEESEATVLVVALLD